MKRTPHHAPTMRLYNELTANYVASWLNGAVPDHDAGPGVFYRPSDGAQARIAKVVLLISTISETSRPDAEKPCDPSLIEDLNRILSRYPTVFRWSISLAERLYGYRGGTFSRVPEGRRWDVQEAYAIESIVELAQAHALDKISRCLCGRWYFRRKADHTSCSIACRKKKHETTPEYKARKAAIARKARSARHIGMGTKTKRRRSTAKK